MYIINILQYDYHINIFNQKYYDKMNILEIYIMIFGNVFLI